MEYEKQIYDLALSIVKGIGPVISGQIMRQVKSAKAFFDMSPQDRLEHFTDIPEKILVGDYAASIEHAKKEIEWCAQHNIRLLSFTDDKYPRRLQHIPDKPLALYVKGDCDLSGMRTVAIVGTRKPTEYGKAFVDMLVRELKPYGVHIISGMAYGIDGAAHSAALRYNIPTIGVMGHGIDRVYPTKHKRIADELLQQGGALLTEFPHGTDPEREHFPMRNRIIAGMSDVIIIVESAEKGGSMITADLGNNYNKDVFALPGRYNDKRSRGCNLLIKSQRAHLLESVKDIEYIMRWQAKENEVGVQTGLFLDLSHEQKELLLLLKHHKKLYIDEIAGKMSLTNGKVSEILLTLELEGLVKCLPGNMYIAI